MKPIRGRHAAVFAVSLGVVACSQPVETAPDPRAGRVDDVPALTAEAPPFATPVGPGKVATREFVFDVDPFHASAFERPTEAPAADALAVAVHVPLVAHDAATGRTQLTLALGAGDTAGGSLAVHVAGGPTLRGSRDLVVSAANPNVALDFENPEGTSFTLTVSVVGQTKVATPRRRQLLSLAQPTATSDGSAPGFGPERAVDGNLNTEWGSAAYRGASAWLALDAGEVASLSAVRVKARPFGGQASYAIEVSANGVAYTPVASGLRNTGWGLETKTLPAGTTGRYVRLRFTNDAASPETRFMVFAAELVGTGGGTPGPSTAPTATPGPTPTPAATPTPGPTPTPGSSGQVVENFQGATLGSDPSTFVDPLDEGYRYSWMPRIRWRVADSNGSRQYMHDGNSSVSNLSFRRYRGGAFGANGRLPERYAASVRVTPLASNTYYRPTGDQGTPFYYKDPTHYVELLIKPNLFEVWVANGAQPFTTANWSRIYYQTTRTSGGQARTLSCNVDANAHTIEVYLDGSFRATRTSALLAPGTHYLALRGAGNVVLHDDVTIRAR